MVRCDWLRALCSAPCAHAPSGVGGGGGGVSTVSKAALQPVKMCFRIPMPLLESRVNEARLVRGPEVAHFIVRAAPTQIGLWAPDGHGRSDPSVPNASQGARHRRPDRQRALVRHGRLRKQTHATPPLARSKLLRVLQDHSKQKKTYNGLTGP